MTTLSELIGFLEQQDKSTIITFGFGEPMSCRGYYEDLSFTPKNNVSIASMLVHAKSAMGTTYTGYKGGEFTMDEYSRCWISEYGQVSESLISPTLLHYWELE